MKYISALMVIGVHTKMFMPFSSTLNFAFSSILARIAVPFFLISSAYFLKRGMAQKTNYLKTYLQTLLKGYFLWSVLYLPIGINWITDNYHLPLYLYPVALIVGLFYIGTYYHLWYIPALIIAVLGVNWLLKKTNYSVVIAVSLVLYTIGSLETYYSLFANERLQWLINRYLAIFITTRNGLFYGFIFVAIGFFIWDHQDSLKAIPYTKGLIVSIALLIQEAFFIFDKPRHDMNFLLSLVPLSFFLFLFLKEQVSSLNLNTSKIRDYGKYYYFIHAFFLVLFPPLVKLTGFELWESHGLLRFALVLGATHLTAFFLIQLKAQPSLPWRLSALLNYL